MVLWNKVLSAFDTEDETVNFGTRTVAESYDSVYETTTLATIQANGEITKNPQVVASIQNNSMLCVTIDKSITIFNDKSCQEIKLCIGFDSSITSHCMSKDSCFLFITLTNGTLYCLNLEAGGQLIFFRNVIQSYEDSNEVILKVFLHADHTDSSDILLLTSKKYIYRMSGFDEKVMNAVRKEHDIGELEELTKNIQCSLVFKENNSQNITFAEVNLLDDKPSVVMIGDDIYIWPSQLVCPLNNLHYKYVKVQYLKNRRFLLCLRTDGAINLVCSSTLLAKKVWDGSASDMVIVEDETNTQTDILVLLKAQQHSSITFLQLISFPDFEVKFNLQVPVTTYLVNMDIDSIDGMVFLEGAGESLATIDTIKVKAVEENLPECRLQRLLSRGKYDEAEILAKRFHLSTDSIHCAKASFLIKQLDSSTDDNDVSKKLKELFNLLDRIKNVKLIFEYCHNTVTSDLDQTRRLISYARERLIKDAENKSDDLTASHLLLLNSTLLRIETYELIQRTRENTTACSNENISNWAKFYKSDLFNECKNYLRDGELKVAALIWVRHSSTLLACITTDVVKDMLETIPDELLLIDLWPWLFHFIPSLLSVCPDGLSEIVTWGCKKAKSFEKFDQKNWPESGLDFCKSLIKLLNFEESQSFFYLQQQYTTKHSPLQHLTAIIQALTDLIHLKKNYRLVVKIDAYMGEPIEVSHLLLQKVYPQEVSHFIKNFLHQYMLNHALKNDHILILYIQKTLKSSKGWWFWEEAPWEQKIVNIISCIHNVESRLQQTLDTLKKASVPWSPTMLQLVETNTSIKHSLVSAIINERNTVGTKLILKKYGYQHIGISDNLIRYIIKQNRDGMLEDLYELSKSNHSLKTRTLSLCVNFFMNNGKLEQMMTVIKSQTDGDAIYCCRQVVNYISVCLRFKELNHPADYYREILEAVENKLRSTLLSVPNADTFLDDDTLTTASQLKTLCLLRKEFKINISLMEYQTKNEIILQKNLKHLCNDKNLSTFSTYKKARRLASLLGLPQIVAVCWLLEFTCNIEILNYYIEGFIRAGCFPAEECPYIKRLCQICIFNLKNQELEALNSLRNISASALDNCSIEELSSMLFMVVWIGLSCEITGNKTTNGLMRKNEVADERKWRLHKIYTNTLMCSNQMILPIFIEFFKFHLHYMIDEKRFQTGTSILSKENYCSQFANLIAQVISIPTENYDFLFLQILNTLALFDSFVTTNEQIIPQIQLTRDSCLRTLLERIISNRIFDLQSGLSCLYMFPEQDASKWLISISKIYQTDSWQHSAISDLGYEYCRSIRNKSHFKYFTYYQVCHHWARKLHDYGVHHKELLSNCTEGKQQILERLMQSKKPGFIELLKEYCIDFQFELDQCYILYIDILLKQWNPTIKLVVFNGEKELRINEDEIVTLYKTCKQIAALIEEKSALRNHLATLWSKINFYHYEVFLLIMELLEDKNEQRLNHFCFLQNYVRFGPPTKIEYEEWSQLCPENSSLPEISKWRLPFLPKVNQWKLITPELNLSTYKKWLEVAPILNLQSHVVCSLAIKETVAQVWGLTDESKKKNSNEWLIHSENSGLLEDIKTCIKHMPDQDALYYGTAALYYVVNHTPPGADQAAAAQECYASAQKWAEASVQSDEAMIEKIKYKYLQLTAKHILHTHGLGSDRYLKLVIFPERLVRELYIDPSIVSRCRGATENRPDINSAVNALGKIFSFNIMKLQLELLEEWLQPSDSNSKLDDSMTFDIIAVSSRNEDNNKDKDNLLRACYLLESGDKVMSANYLINIGFGMKAETSFRPGIQFRALCVLLSITDSAMLENLTKRDFQSIRHYMKSLRYVSELEKLGFTFSVNKFESTDKLALAQTLSRTHSRSPEALVLILQICIDFELKNYTLWDETLGAMAKMCMVKELRKFLPIVATVSHAVSCNGCINGWEVMIWEPFRETNALLSQKQFDECITSISLLHLCPVASKLNLEPIIKICFQSHRPELAAVFLPFLTENDRNFVVKIINSSYEVPKVIEDLKALTTKGILTITYSVQILEDLLQLDDEEKNETKMSIFL